MHAHKGTHSLANYALQKDKASPHKIPLSKASSTWGRGGGPGILQKLSLINWTSPISKDTQTCLLNVSKRIKIDFS